MHNMGKTIAELHVMLKLHEKGIFTIELYAFPNKTWVYDTGCRTHIYNTSQGLRGRKRLKHGALSLYVGNGMRGAVEAIGSFDLVLPGLRGRKRLKHGALSLYVGNGMRGAVEAIRSFDLVLPGGLIIVLDN
nr:hypothetical protein [Tanacetum cinerariifolium]